MRPEIVPRVLTDLGKTVFLLCCVYVWLLPCMKHFNLLCSSMAAALVSLVKEIFDLKETSW